MGLVAIGVVLIGATAYAASSTLTDESGQYHGCVKNAGQLRIIQPGESCGANETAITWNVQGPRGDTGPQGPKGDTGAQGPAGVVSLATLAGTACRRADGSAGKVSVTTATDNSISLNCGTGADWCLAQPPAGLHVQAATCDSETQSIVLTCDVGWLDANADPRDGCERSVEGLSNISFDYQRAAVLSTMFFAIPGDTAAPFPIAPGCSGGLSWAACTGGQPANPLPSIVADGAQRAGDQDRAVVIPDSTNSEFHVTLRFRLTTQQPIPVTIPTLGDCNLSIDTTAGHSPDATLTLIDHVAAGSPTGPTVISDISIQQLENDDFSFSGNVLCDLATPGSLGGADALTAIVQNAIAPWITRVATLCGASESPYFQVCPAK